MYFITLLPITLYFCPTPSEPPLPDRLISDLCVLLCDPWLQPTYCSMEQPSCNHKTVTMSLKVFGKMPPNATLKTLYHPKFTTVPCESGLWRITLPFSALDQHHLPSLLT